MAIYIFGSSDYKRFKHQSTHANLPCSPCSTVVRCFCTSSGWFKRSKPPRTFTGETRCAGCLCNNDDLGVVQAHRTSSNHIITEIARCVEFFHMTSGWFDCTEPSLTTSLQGKQGVQGAYAIMTKNMAHAQTAFGHVLPLPLLEPVLQRRLCSRPTATSRFQT